MREMRGDEASVLNKLSICIEKPLCLFKCHVSERGNYFLASSRTMKQICGFYSIEKKKARTKNSKFGSELEYP